MAATGFLLSVCLFLGSFSLARGQTNLVFGVYRELWTNLNPNVGGLAALTNTAYNTNWPSSPVAAYTKVYTNFETEANTGMNYYGERLRTFVVPPASGNYVFWISSDDNSDLFVSSDESPANKAQVAWVSTWTNPREWTKETNQQSAPLPLQAGRRYYVEARMQQGTGGDNLAVRWQMPNGRYEEPLTAASLAGTRLVPCGSAITAPGIFVQPSNATVVEGQNATFSLLVTNQCPMSYQWLVNSFTPLAGARAAAWTVSNASIALNNGQLFACVVSNSLGTVTSALAMLTVIRDTVPPTVARVFNVGGANVQVVFSKTVEAASATNLANYAFTNALPITGASLGADNLTLTLTTAPMVYGSNYGLVINGVRDRASIPNTIATNTLAVFLALACLTQDIGNPSAASVVGYAGANGLSVTTSGGVIGTAADQCGFEYQMFTGDFDLSVRLPGLSASDPWAKAGLMARQTLDASSRFAAALTTPSMSGSFFEWRNPANSPSTMAGVFPPNLPNAWLRLRRAATTFTGYASYDGQAWTLLGSASITMPAQVYVGLAASSHNSNLAATAQFRDLGNVTSAAVNTVPYP